MTSRSTPASASSDANVWRSRCGCTPHNMGSDWIRTLQTLQNPESERGRPCVGPDVEMIKNALSTLAGRWSNAHACQSLIDMSTWRVSGTTRPVLDFANALLLFTRRLTCTCGPPGNAHPYAA